MRRVPFLTIVALSLLLAGLAAATLVAASGSGGWQRGYVPPGDLEVSFADVATRGGLVGLAVGDIEEGGPVSLIPVVFRTTDGGSTWESVSDEQVYGTLNGVAFSDATHAWAVGADYGSGDRQGAVLLTSSDAGETWETAPLSGTAALQRVRFPTADAGYITADNGVVYRTIDAGAHWTSVAAAPSDVMLRGLSFTDATHGWVCGPQGNEDFYGGRCYATGDGGVTWQDVTPDEDAFLTDCSFVTGGKGWVVSQDASIFHTADGGATWARQSAAVGSAVELTSVGFADALNGWAVGSCWPLRYGRTDWAVILHTTDGGETWVQQDCDVQPAVEAVAALGATSAWAVGTRRLALYTADGGGAGFSPQERPETVALNAVTVRRGAKATFRFRVDDPGVPHASATVLVHDARGRLVKSFAAGVGATGTARTVVARVNVAAGHYTWKVACTDYAGYTQRSAKPRPLTVE